MSTVGQLKDKHVHALSGVQSKKKYFTLQSKANSKASAIKGSHLAPVSTYTLDSKWMDGIRNIHSVSPNSTPRPDSAKSACSDTVDADEEKVQTLDQNDSFFSTWGIPKSSPRFSVYKLNEQECKKKNHKIDRSSWPDYYRKRIMLF